MPTTTADTLSERARMRLRDELYARRIMQRDACAHLERATGETWSQSRLSKTLNGEVGLLVDIAAALADMAGITLVDIVREPGRELVADLTPSEMQLLQAVRSRPQLLPALLQLLGPTARGERHPASIRAATKASR